MGGRHADFDDLHAELVVKVSHAEHLRPESLAGGQRVHADGGAHVLKNELVIVQAMTETDVQK